jgi:hypothetical protein
MLHRQCISIMIIKLTVHASYKFLVVLDGIRTIIEL